MAVNLRKILAIVAIIVVIALTAFLLYWFLGRKTETPVNYLMVKYDQRPDKTKSFNGDNLPSPELNQCGQTFPFNYSATGDFAAPGGTFGWTAYFDYSWKGGPHLVDMLRCGGFVINERYILTAAHCLYGTYEQELKLDKIRLGLASETNKTNCDSTGECQSSVWLGIEDIIPHQDYNPKSKIPHNDIALIRVDQDIKFTKFVKPICLRDKTELAGKKFLAGWAKNIPENRLEPKKYVTVLTYVDGTKCNKYFEDKYDVAIDSSKICASGAETKEFCIRDTGNALAALVNERWHAEGIDAFGKTCGDKDSMGIYIEVAHYYKWIKGHINK